MVPIVFVQNAVNSSISSLSPEKEIIYLDLTKIEPLFDAEDGVHSIDDEVYHVITVENLKFLVFGRVEYLSDDGKKNTIHLDHKFIVNYCTQLYQFHYEQTEEIINYMHDIQYLVGAFLHNSRVKENEEGNIDILAAKLKRINYLTGVMSAKSAYFQYLTEDIQLMKLEDVSLTKKVYKITKTVGFLSRSLKKNMKCTFNVIPPKSDCLVEAPDILDFIPFQIIENAIKYSPYDSDIDVELYESKDVVLLTVESMGPKIDNDELERIFEKGYRGRHGRFFEEKGHGLGLFQTRKALSELIDGSIHVEQNENYFKLEGVDFSCTKFILSFPRKING